jgi:hypothetical protein
MAASILSPRIAEISSAEAWKLGGESLSVSHRHSGLF